MVKTSESLAERLEREGKKNLLFFEKLSPEDWEKQVYSDGAAWSVRDMFTHVVETEQTLPRLFQGIISGGGGVGDEFDFDYYNESKVVKAGEISPQDLLNTFAARRKETVKFVTDLSEEDLLKIGSHPFLGHAEIAEMVKLMYIHVQLHIRDVRNVIKED